MFIQVDNLVKNYENIPAVKGISFTVEEGMLFSLLGVNGAGKSTTINILTTLLEKTSGKVKIDGHDLDTASNQIRDLIGIVFQELRLLNTFSVYDNIAFAARVMGGSEKSIKKRVFDSLAVVGLAHKACNFPPQLSGGEQQRVAIARAIVNEPLLLIADEPTGNLDRVISDEIFALLQEINNWGTTIIMATHDLSFVERSSHREIVLSKGKVIKGKNNKFKMALGL